MFIRLPIAIHPKSAVSLIARTSERVVIPHLASAKFQLSFHSTSHMNGIDTKPTNGASDMLSVSTDKMAYTNCQTQIIDLKPLRLPSDRAVPDTSLRQIYRDYIATQKLGRSHLSPKVNGTDGKSSNHIQQASDLAAAILSLKTGIAPPVAFPTETVYGLGADATNAASIAGIFAAKGRPSDNPLIVHVSSVDHLERCLGGTETMSAIPENYRDLVAEFWPGPLTILIPVPPEGRGVKFAPNVHPGQKTIGFRIPSSPYARFLIAVADRPIAAPSANSSGKPSPTTAQHVKDDLDGKINFILDGGSCDVGVESTVVDGLGETPLILRPGGLSRSILRGWGKRKGNIWQHVENGWETKKSGSKRKRFDETSQVNGSPVPKLQKVSNGHKATTNGHVSYDSRNTSVEVDEDENEDSESTAAPKAPGMKYKHYAPKARMFLFEGPSSSTSPMSSLEPVHEKLKELMTHRQASLSTSTLTIGILSTTFWPDPSAIRKLLQVTNSTRPQQAHLEVIQLGKTSATISRSLFATLRKCDDLACDFIFAEAPSRAAIIRDELSHIDGHDGTNKTSLNSRDEDIEEEEEDFETVLERMRKASSEIVSGT